MAYLRALCVGLATADSALFTAQLKPEGIECVEVSDGIAAIQHASDFGIDLIIASVKLRGLDLVELIDLARRGLFGKRPPPMIVVSDSKTRFAGVSADNSDFHVVQVSAPVDDAKILKALAAAFPDV